MSAESRARLLGMVVLSPREEMARMDRVTTDETLRQDLEDSARERGLVYCDMCGCWFFSSCMCDSFREE
jgi:hypothetical protein